MLHGDVRVNFAVIGEWTAVRKERVDKDPDREGNSIYYRYECTIEYRDMGGYLKQADFEIFHRYGDGAMRLAAKVLTTGYERAKRKPLP